MVAALAVAAALRGAAADAGDGRERLERTAPVGGARPELPLAALAPVGAGAAAVPALGGAWRTVEVEGSFGGALALAGRAFGALADGPAGVGGAVPAFGPVAWAAKPVVTSAPATRPRPGRPRWMWIPSSGSSTCGSTAPSGMCAAKRWRPARGGDLGQYGYYRALYWERMETALERRTVHRQGGGLTGEEEAQQ